MACHPTTSFVSAVVTACLAGAAFAGNAQYEFFLVESFDPSYALASTQLFNINNDNVGLGSDTFGAFTWTEEGDKDQLPFSGVNSLNNLGWVNYGNVLYHPITQEEIDIPSPSAAYPQRTLMDLNDNMVGVGVSGHSGPGCEPFDCPYDCSNNLVWDQVNGSRHIPVADLKAFHAVNNHNVAVGVIIVNCDDNRGVVYDLNTDEMINLSDLLPPIDLLGIPAQVWPTDINDAGQVIGTASTGDQIGAFVWSEEGGFTFLPVIPGGESGYMHVNSINNHGVVIGDALDYTVMDWKSFIWDAENGIRVLEDLVDEPTNFLVENAFDINENGWIVGSGHFGPGWATQRGFVLKPVAPETLAGDLDASGAVDEQDRALFCAALGSADGEPGYMHAADLDASGAIDHLDQQMFNAMLPPCSGDVVASDTFAPPADGVTDGADLAYLLGAWGAQPSCADFVTSTTFQPPPDGNVDGADLAYMLGAWGACE